MLPQLFFGDFEGFCGLEWESAKVSNKRVFALLTPEIHSYEMANMLQKPVFALPGCQRMSVNTLLCDTLGLADLNLQERQTFQGIAREGICNLSKILISE